MHIPSARSLLRPRAVAIACAAAAVSLLSACGGSGGSATTEPTDVGLSTTPVANPALDAVYKGTLTSPDTTSRPAVKGKKIVIISSGQSSISSSIPVNAAEDAAKKLGWSVSVYDDQLNPANDPNLVQQALASGADGIILDAIDCQFVKSQ